MNQDERESAHQRVHEASDSESPSNSKVTRKFPPSAHHTTEGNRSQSILKDDTQHDETRPHNLDPMLESTRSETTRDHDAETSDLDKKPSGDVERTSSSKPMKGDKITIPAEFDVVFGRGKPFQSHPGNQRLHQIVTLHKDQYQAARRYDKLAIAQQVVDSIKSGGMTPGRFLRRVQGEEGWEIVPDDVAREKVAHALRGKLRPTTAPEETTVTKRRASNVGPTHNTNDSLSTQQMLPHMAQQQEPMSAVAYVGPASIPASLGFAAASSSNRANALSFDAPGMEERWRMMDGGLNINSWGWNPTASSLLSAKQQLPQQQCQLPEYHPALGIRNQSGGMLDSREILRQQLLSAYQSQNPSVSSFMFGGTGLGSMLSNPSLGSNNASSLASLGMQSAAAAAAAASSSSSSSTPSNVVGTSNVNISLDVAFALLNQERDIARRRAAIERALRRDPSGGGGTGDSNSEAFDGPNQNRFRRFF